MAQTPQPVTVQVIVPARNEEDCIGRCLESLANQEGISHGITVVDDGSTDRTREIAASFPDVRVLTAHEPHPGISGKCNALMIGARRATAEWLLFTDADTCHYPGSLAAAVKEAEEHDADLLSYSPEQETGSWQEKMLIPVVYAELARTYPTVKVNDPADPTVAANGQYILVRRSAYEALGGHHAVAHKILEDVELARLFKMSGHKIRFHYGAGRVRTRMYRTFAAMWEGWTKNLAILFGHPLRLAAWRLAEFSGIVAFWILGFILRTQDNRLCETSAFGLAAILSILFIVRVRRAHFSWDANLLSFLGLPFFALLLIRSWLHSRVRGAVTWKGRKYAKTAPERAADSSSQE